ncbi:hypothetical protein ACFSX9_13170 [Flavobacterium ardleyense]|uniref:Uncharacterized protein n=1 Tax=Flavobacterium ardleyense TaxID=2038737 RepID=A0ABW5ZAA5_9FLAO
MKERIILSEKIYWTENEYLLSDKKNESIYFITNITYADYITGTGKLNFKMENRKETIEFSNYKHLDEFIKIINLENFLSKTTKKVELKDIIRPHLLIVIFILSFSLIIYLLFMNGFSNTKKFMLAIITGGFAVFYAISKTSKISEKIIYKKTTANNGDRCTISF